MPTKYQDKTGEWINGYSSFIAKFRYDAESKTHGKLKIAIYSNGGLIVYTYHEVPPIEFEDFVDIKKGNRSYSSLGTYYNKVFKSKGYDYDSTETVELEEEPKGIVQD